MPCYRPLQAWKGKVLDNGKRDIVFKRAQAAGALSLFDLKLPCGQCVGCRLERSRQWAMRCVDEASLYKRNCFITLTYDNMHVPENGSLVLRDFQLFMKRLRKENSDHAIRFYHCGEYGEKFGRPHYHALLFNHDFSDKVAFQVRDDSRTYTSKALSALWPVGHSLIGDVTFESAAYVARYVMKKVTGAGALEHYVNKATGEVLAPEYTTMSRRPGIGRGWYDKFKLDMYPSDFRIMRGVKMRPSRFYDGLYELEDPLGFRVLKSARVVSASRFSSDNDSFRLPVKEEVKIAQIRTLSRNLEDQ